MAENKVVDIVMDEKTKERMKNVLAFRVDAEFNFVPAVCREKDKKGEYFIPKNLWPVFTLKSLNGIDLSEVEDHISYRVIEKHGDDVRMRLYNTTGSARIEILKRGVISHSNYRDMDGKVIPFTGEETIAKYPVSLQNELQDAIEKHSVLTEDETRGLEF
jgi:hypothetical protein